jgi:thiol-disulfide isomerase/thioredoxin
MPAARNRVDRRHLDENDAELSAIGFLARTALVIGALSVAAGAAAVGVGETAPAFALPTAAGDTVTLDKLRGRIVYVDFWASWCAPCRRSFPWMNEMQQKYGPRGFVVVGVNVDKKRADARSSAQIPASSPWCSTRRAPRPPRTGSRDAELPSSMRAQGGSSGGFATSRPARARIRWSRPLT